MASILAADTSLTIDVAMEALFPVANTGASAVGTPGLDYFKAVLQDTSGNIEIIYVRTRAMGVATLTNVQRGQEGTTARNYAAGSIVGLRLTAADHENALADVGVRIAAATSKATPVDADSLALSDSAASNVLKKLTWANLKASLGIGKNKLINGNFGINQRVYVSGAATVAGQYTLDRWKVTGTGGITFSTTNNVTTVTIPSGQTLQQVIEGVNLQSGTHVLSWSGTAQGRIDGGAYGASGAVTATAVGGTNMTVEFNTGTVSLAQLEEGSLASRFEHRQYGVEEILCKRYCQSYKQASGNLSFAAFLQNSSIALSYQTLTIPMRTTPTGTMLPAGYSDSNWSFSVGGGADITATSISIADISNGSYSVQLVGSSALSAGTGGRIRTGISGYGFLLSAEL